jgi:transcriptional regulator with XRE-family HTH domain
MNIVGPTIRETRVKLNLSQKDLVARCNLLGWGISRGTLAKIESKTRKLSDSEVLCLAKALKVEVGVLFEGV